MTIKNAEIIVFICSKLQINAKTDECNDLLLKLI
jgi:hypothetical protein